MYILPVREVGRVGTEEEETQLQEPVEREAHGQVWEEEGVTLPPLLGEVGEGGRPADPSLPAQMMGHMVTTQSVVKQ